MTACLAYNRKPTQEHRIRNVGLIQIAPERSLRTENTALSTSTLKENAQEYVYEPPMALDMSKVSLTLVHNGEHIITLLAFKEEKGVRPCQGTKADERFVDMVSTLIEQSRRHIEIHQHYRYTHANLGGVAILGLLLLVYLARGPISSLCCKSHRSIINR